MDQIRVSTYLNLYQFISMLYQASVAHNNSFDVFSSTCI